MAGPQWRNPLPGVPAVESPFFKALFEGQQAPPGWLEAARALRRDGFAVIDFPDPGFAADAEAIKRDLAPAFDLPWWRKQAHGARQSLRVQDAWRTHEAVRRIACNREILSLLAYLYGRPAFPFQTLNFPVGTQQHFHTDAVHFHSVPERFMCGVWVALEDVDDDNGPLIYYPGSHRWPVYGNDQIGHYTNRPMETTQSAYEPLWRALVEAEGLTPQRFRARKGQALIWAANLLHGGAEHANLDRTRWSQVTHYFFDGCAYLTPMQSDPYLGRVAFREPFNILTGGHQKNHYGDQPLPEAAIKQMRPPIGRAAPPDRLPADFDPRLYLAANPDVAAAKVDAAEHYMRHGRFEGRRLRP